MYVFRGIKVDTSSGGSPAETGKITKKNNGFIIWETGITEIPPLIPL
jgi:hypothetical protein